MKYKKHIFCITSILTMLFSLTGCGASSEEESRSAQTINELTSESSTNSWEQNPADAKTPETTYTDNEVEVDLTQMSSTMVYSEVYNMVSVPDDYEGKIVKASGTFAVYHDDEKDKDYFAVLISDATACCSQGIEFVLSGDKTYPDDYPAIDEEVTVTGVMNSYVEDGYTYCQLLSAELSK